MTLSAEVISEILDARFGTAVDGSGMGAARPYVRVKAEAWPEVAVFLRDDERLRFNLLNSIAALDLLADDKLACVYDLTHIDLSLGTRLVDKALTFAVRVETDRENPVIPTVSHVWPAADWHEREAFDLMGIHFSGHPDLRRILCPDDWEGHPLRKDYQFPLEYHGIPATTEYQLTNPRH